MLVASGTGKSLSEAPIFASTDPQLIELQDQYIHENLKLKPGENMLCTEIFSDIQNNFCTQHVLPCSAKRRTSDKDFLYFLSTGISFFCLNV